MTSLPARLSIPERLMVPAGPRIYKTFKSRGITPLPKSLRSVPLKTYNDRKPMPARPTDPGMQRVPGPKVFKTFRSRKTTPWIITSRVSTPLPMETAPPPGLSLDTTLPTNTVTRACDASRSPPPDAMSVKRALKTRVADKLANGSLHEKSIRSYKSAWAIFSRFALSIQSMDSLCLDDPSTPLDNEVVLMWVVTLIDAKVSAGIIASKISALKWMCDIHAKPHGLDTKSVSRMLGVAHRGNTFAPEKAKPVVPDDLKALFTVCTSPSALPWHTRILTIMLLCFTGFLRIGECLAIRRGHLLFAPSHLTISCPARKGDRYRVGSKVHIARLPDSDLCPVAFLESYILSLPLPALPADPIFPGLGASSPEGPAFISYSTIRKHLMKVFSEANLDLDGLRSHSFRVGGATQAHKAGISDAVAAKHGDWKDLLTYHGYVEPVLEDQLLVSRSLSL